MTRPTGKPYDVVGPVTIYVQHNDLLPYASGACAWVGDYLVGEYDGYDVVVRHPTDQDRNVVTEERDGDVAVDRLIDGVRRWLGYHRALRRSHARMMPR